MKIPALGLLLGAGIFCVLVSGCSSLGQHYVDANKDLVESGQAYVRAANKALPDNPEKAKKYTEYAENVLGRPAEDLTDEQLEARHKHDAQVLADRQKAADGLIELGKIKEQENNKNLISRLWHWGLATFGIAGCIAICVLFPPIIPVLLQLIVHVAVWWFSHFPAIVGAIWSATYSATSQIYTAIKNSKPKT